jgi:hypothetical protein
MSETARVIDITEVEQKDTEIEKKALQIVDIKSTIQVVDNDSMSLADDLKKKCRDVIKMIDEEYQPIAKSAFDHHRNVTARWNAKKKPYQEFEVALTNQVKLYLAEVRRKQEAEEARLREIARKEEEERRLAEAAELEAEGRADEADEVLEAPVTYVAPVVRIETPKVDNRMYRTQLKVRVKDRIEFLAKCPPDVLLMCLNEAAWSTIESGLSRKAKALGKAFSQAGCEVYEA